MVRKQKQNKMSFSEEDEAAATQILDALQDFVNKCSVFQFELNSKQLILGVMQDFEFGMISSENFPVRILKTLVPGWLIGEIADLVPFEKRIQKIIQDWHTQKTAKLAAIKPFTPVHFSDDLH